MVLAALAEVPAEAPEDWPGTGVTGTVEVCALAAEDGAALPVGTGATGTTAGAVPVGAVPAGAPDVCELAPGAAEPGAPGAPGAPVVEHTQLVTVTVDTMVTGETEAPAPPVPPGPAPPGAVTLAPGAAGMPITGALPVLTQESARKMTFLHLVTEVLLVV